MDYGEKVKLINIKTNKLIKKLHLIKSNNYKIQLDNCCKLQRYIVLNNTYDESIMTHDLLTPEEIITNELYNALVTKKVVCTSNSILFTHVLSKVGIEVYNLSTIYNSSNSYHMANLVKLNKKYYIFDTTWDGGLHKYKKTKHISTAGIGGFEIYILYTPRVTYDNNFNVKIIENKDISDKSISKLKLLKYKY